VKADKNGERNVPSSAANSSQLAIRATPSPHVMIRASAGTGKTFQLSNRFLKLAADGQPVDQILAVTFTRAAAGEILERVLLRLANAADDPKQLAALGQHIGRPDFTQAECVGLLRQLTTSLHRLQIGTLDSFFFRLAGNFGLELGLPLGWQIVDELEDEQIRADAIQRLLADCELSETTGLVSLLSKGEAVRSVTREINDVVKNMYDVYRETAVTPDVWTCLPHQRELEPAQLADALTALARLPAATNKSFEKGRLADRGRAEDADWEGFVAVGIAAKIILKETTFCRVPLAAELLAAYQPLLDHARATLVNRLANQTEGTRRMLGHFDAAFRPLKYSRRALRFDDLTHELAAALADGRLGDFGWRLDARVNHLLVDEFQDTSLAQWSVLRPLVAQVCRHGAAGSFFCVGDVKQAIYGWRGGTAELFNTVGSEVPGIHEEHLTRSFRSSPAVIDLVNEVFSGIAANPVVEKYPDVADTWAAQFQEHSTVHADLPGRCRLLTAPQAGANWRSKEQQAATLGFAAMRIAALAAENPGRSIGVLVRRNNAIAQLIYQLRHRHKLPVSEEGGNPLTDSPAVELILSLLALADHPGDTAARFHVAHSPLGAAVGFERHDDDLAATGLASNVRRQLMDLGYGPTLYDWVRALAPACGRRDLSRLLQLVEFAYRCDEGPLRRPAEFLAQVRRTKIDDPASAPIRVMTIHRAKGLEFDIVVLPQLDESLVGSIRPKLVVGRPTAAEPIHAVSRYAGQAIQTLLPDEFQKMFAAWKDRSANESLCTLYVALTRAKRDLEMIIAPTNKAAGETATLAGVLRAALAPDKEASPESLLYGERDDSGSTETPMELPQPEIEPLEVKLATATARRRGLERRSPSKLEGGQKVDLGRRLRLETSAAMTAGTLIHAWLEQIAWLEDGEPDEATLRQLAAPLVRDENELLAAIGRFRKILAQPTVRAQLASNVYQRPVSLVFGDELTAELVAGLNAQTIHLELHRERRFAVRLDDAIVNGSFDRLLLFRRGDAVVAVDILDFKTDAVAEPTAIAARVEYYQPQLAEYRRAAAELFRLPPEKISARILFVEPGVIEVVANQHA